MSPESSNIPLNVAIVGAGPATVYLLAALARQRTKLNGTITIFESSDVIGRGTPYSSYSSQYKMLSNLNEDEVPELHISFGCWCERNYITRDKNTQNIVPRYLLGQYFEDAFHYYLRILQPYVTLITRCEITRIEPAGDKQFLVYHHSRPLGAFSQIVINTGHGTIDRSQSEGNHPPFAHYFKTPYPLQRILDRKCSQVIIRGASLTAIDCALAVAQKHGYFIENSGGLHYESRSPLHITMFSTSGRFPGPWFASLDLQSDIAQAFEEKVSKDNTICLQTLFDTGFIEFLAHNAPSVYQQVRFKNIEEVVEYLLSNRKKLNVETLLKVEVLSYSVNRESTENWQGVLECFGNVLHRYSHLLNKHDLDCYQQVLKPFIAKANAALPSQSAAKIHALLQAGCLSLQQRDIPKTEFKILSTSVSCTKGTLYVDCTSGDSLESCCTMLQPLLQAGFLTHKSRATPDSLDLRVNQDFQAIGTHEPSHIFIGAPSLISTTLMTLPGLEVNDYLSTTIARALLWGHAQSPTLTMQSHRCS